ncbi:MAG: GGDEF domain-containing protein [Microthrixaceae bacterium]
MDPDPDLRSVRPADTDGVRPFGTFDEACGGALRHLHRRYGMSQWFVSRTVGDDYVLLRVEGDAFPIAAGDVMRWADSLCRLLSPGTSRAVPEVARAPEMAGLAVVVDLDIHAYLGVPLYGADGALFGTLGAIDRREHGPELWDCLPEVDVVGALLMTVLEAELRVEQEQRRAERASDDARTDALCGIPNRRAWNDAVAREEARCRRYGSPAGVVVVDLDGLKAVNDEHGHAAGDALLRRASRVLASVVRDSDLVARLGGDEFAVLAPGATIEDLEVLVARLSASLSAAQVRASVGASSRRVDMSLLETWHDADREMYRRKARLGTDRSA